MTSESTRSRADRTMAGLDLGTWVQVMVKGITGITKKSAKRYHFFYICIVIGLMESWFFPWDFFLKKVYGR